MLDITHGSGLQMALLFLTRKGIPLELVWRRWLEKVKGVVPATWRCNPDIWQCLVGMQSAWAYSNVNNIFSPRTYILLQMPPPLLTPIMSSTTALSMRACAMRYSLRLDIHPLCICITCLH